MVRAGLSEVEGAAIPVKIATRKQIQEIDLRATQEYGIPAATLMERAGKAVADLVLREFRPRAVTVVCGKGNNGGDGFVAARLLAKAGVKTHVRALGVAAEYRGPALENLRKVEPGPLVWGDVVVDAVFGTGLRRRVRGLVRHVLEEINGHPPIVAVDVPSGLDADTGEPLGTAVRATVTVTMGLPKAGLLRPEAKPYVGRLVVADIGYPEALVASVLE